MFLRLDTSTHTTRATSSNQTHLLSSRRASATSRRLTNVLVVTSSMRMVHRVHAHASHLRPLVALHSVLVVAATSLQHRLVHTTSSSHDTHHRTAASINNRYHHSPRRNRLLDSRRQTHERARLVVRVTNHRSVVTAATSQTTAIAHLVLHVAHNRSLRKLTQRKHVAHAHLRLLSAIHSLTRVHAFRSNEQLLVHLVVVTNQITHNHTLPTDCGTSREPEERHGPNRGRFL